MASADLNVEDRDRIAVERLRFLVLSAVAQDVAEIVEGDRKVRMFPPESLGLQLSYDHKEGGSAKHIRGQVQF